MPNTAKTPGSKDIRTFIEQVSDNATARMMIEALYVQDAASYKRAVAIASALADEIGDVAGHPVNGYLDLLFDAIARYETSIYPEAKSSPVEMLKYLMDAQGVKQADLADIFGSQGNVSQVLKGEREINLRHVRKLAERFHVNPAVFI